MSLSAEDAAWIHYKLQGVPVPRFFSIDQFMPFAESMQKLKVPAGKTIVQQGQKGDTCYLIRSGRVSVLAETPSGRIKVGQLKEGEFFGEVSVLTGEDRNATVITEEETQLFAIPASTLLEISRANLSIKKNLSTAVSQRPGAGVFDLKKASAPLHKKLLERLKSLLKK
jgi:CRP-like cAMP-binding protein